MNRQPEVASGMRTLIVVPAPGGLSMLIVPSTASTRSEMPTMPLPAGEATATATAFVAGKPATATATAPYAAASCG